MPDIIKGITSPHCRTGMIPTELVFVAISINTITSYGANSTRPMSILTSFLCSSLLSTFVWPFRRRPRHLVYFLLPPTRLTFLPSYTRRHIVVTFCYYFDVYPVVRLLLPSGALGRDSLDGRRFENEYALRSYGNEAFIWRAAWDLHYVRRTQQF
jgi:hypothetical protein